MGSIEMEKVSLGVCYYPEHWDRSLWRDDLLRMQKLGLETARIGEFAWGVFEPKEGEYDFTLFDDFFALAEELGMKVIMGTPSATPPVWLTEKYPEVLNADLDGNTVYHGTRRHVNLSSKKYRELCHGIVETLAKRYSSSPVLIGWQIDNEINCEVDRYHAPADHEAFREYLKEKYVTLENLNRAMGTAFWSQQVSDWNELHLTRRTNTYGETNPHFELEEIRFISYNAISFMKEQADVLKNYRKAGQFITTNGVFGHLDYHKLVGEVVDFITFDSYPNFAFESAVVPDRTNGMKDRNSSDVLTFIRSISPNFGIMEQQSGGGGWTCRMMQPMPKPGQMRLWTYQSMAHGSDFISYFRWRTASFGTEMYWIGLNDPSNLPNRRLIELDKIRREVENLDGLAGSRYWAKVAVVRDYDTLWDGEGDRWHGMCHPVSGSGVFCALQKAHVPFDYLYLTDETTLADLKKYEVLIYPHAVLMNDKRAEIIKEYVRLGGKIVFGARTGGKTMEGQTQTTALPAHLTDLCGLVVEEGTVLSPFDAPVQVSTDGGSFPLPLYHEVLSPTTGKTVGVFDGNYYKDKPALVENTFGKGTCLYLGGVFSEEVVRYCLSVLGVESPFKSFVEADESVELALRRGKSDFIFLLNYDPVPKEITFFKKGVNVLTGEEVEGKTVLEGYDVMIVKY